jgi:hypothetical protein
MSTAETTGPDYLEAMDPGSLASNRRGRLTAGQAVALAPRLLREWLGEAGPFGDAAMDLVGFVALIVVGILLVVVALPLGILFLLVESLRGVTSEEGPLVKVLQGRQRSVATGTTLLAVPRSDFDRMVEGAMHRLYFTRMTLSLVNYERLTGSALAAAERAAAARPATGVGRRVTQVSIWASELESGALPRICVKTGRPAGTQLKFRFATLGGRAGGPLPLIQAWRITFIALRVLLFVIPVAAVALASTALFAPGLGLSVVPFLLGCLLLPFVVYFVYTALRPHADVYANSSGALYVMLRDVHPRFVEGVNAMEPDAPSLSGP